MPTRSDEEGRREEAAVVHDDTRGTLFPVYEVNRGIAVSSVDDGAGWNQT